MIKLHVFNFISNINDNEDLYVGCMCFHKSDHLARGIVLEISKSSTCKVLWSWPPDSKKILDATRISKDFFLIDEY